MILRAAGSHLYPGCRGPIEGRPAAEVMIEFADGSATLGRLEGNELETRPYRTARGTEVPARRWRVEVGVEGFTVRARG